MSPDCATCGREILVEDQVTAREFPEGPHPDSTDPVPCHFRASAYWVHLACSDDGVSRWSRAGRPGDGPLDWVRSNGLNWTGLQQQGENAALVLQGR